MTTEIDHVTKQIVNLENRLDSNNQKVEQKLDQLVHLMQVVASLQERQHSTDNHISEMKSQLKATIDKFEKSVERLHDRFDKNDDRLDKDLAAHFDKARELNEKINQTNNTIDKWTNRGIGLWAGMSALVVIIQTVGGFFLNDFIDKSKAQDSRMEQLQKRQNDFEVDMSRIQSAIRNKQ